MYNLNYSSKQIFSFNTSDELKRYLKDNNISYGFVMRESTFVCIFTNDKYYISENGIKVNYIFPRLG